LRFQGGFSDFDVLNVSEKMDDDVSAGMNGICKDQD
jgi:hypothetical protein